MIRDEDGALTGYVFVDTGSVATGDYVSNARKVLDAQLKLPPGYVVSWSGQYESAQRVRAKLMVVVPVTIAIILMLLYLSTRSAVKTMIVVLAVPFSAVGAIWLVYLLGYNMNVAVWVGLIALLGVDAETGVFMLLYLDLAFEKARRTRGRLTRDELAEAIVEGAAKRLRPKFMTFATMSIGLAPILWSTGAGSAILKRIAAPMVGGICTSFVLELLVYPAIYSIWRSPRDEQEVFSDRELIADHV
jgi:Cu(I)/Ag(I) efflux system membrane protein CusA/SilA